MEDKTDSTKMQKGLETLSKMQLATLGWLSRRIGLGSDTFNGDRNIWDSAGWPHEPSYEQMDLRYQRGGIASQVVEAYPIKCWEKPPVVYEDESPNETAFEESWASLIKAFPIWERLRTLDIMAGRGTFAVLLLGFDDSGNTEAAVEKGSNPNLIYLRPYLPNKVRVHKWNTDSDDSRYGQPEVYKLRRKKDDQSTELTVHWTRILHLADCTEDKDWEGKPRLERVFNHILNLEKVSGGSAEMYWRAGFPGLGLMQDPTTAPLTTAQKTEVDDEIEKFFHGLTRTMKLRGITPKIIQGHLGSPEQSFDIAIKEIAAGSRIPSRVLLGSEQAQLASEQDMEAWLGNVEARCTGFCEPKALRPLIDRLIYVGTLAEPKEYSVEWPSLKVRKPKEIAETAKNFAEALAKYADSANSEAVIDLYHFLVEIMQFSAEKARAIVDKVGGDLDHEEPEIDREKTSKIQESAKDDEEGVS